MERKKLISLAKELNKVLDLEPVIPTQPNVKEATLVEKITTAAGLIDLENDTFSEEAIETMQELDVWPGDEAGDGKAPEDDENATAKLEPEPEPVKEKAKGKGKEKPADKPTPEKAEKKEKVGNGGKKVNEFNHGVEKQAGKIDAVLLTTKNTPLTIEEIAEKSNCSKSWIKAHIKHLSEKHKITFTEDKSGKLKMK